MSAPLLATKLYVPPSRPTGIRRTRLIERLNEGLHRKLTLVSAPAGFGKTILISDWIAPFRESPEPLVAWLSLDEGDSDPIRFLTYFVAALQTVAPQVGVRTLELLRSPQPPPLEVILTTLINDIASLPERVILVLDDYHAVDAQQVDEGLTYLLEHLPPQMHLVIATREDPLLPIGRLRVRGDVTELRADDLRFTATEATSFFNETMGLDLSTEQVAALETRTEGWIAGLQLAALALHGIQSSPEDFAERDALITSFSGSHTYVLDYLLEEVLERQPESIQNFLLQTAILDRLNCALCDALTEQSDGQEMLERLERANLFIVPLDNERRWYRYHHLFADLLGQRLRQRQPDAAPILHGRASMWYERSGFIEQAVEHALRGSDFERAAMLIEEHYGTDYERSARTVQGWLIQLPQELILRTPSMTVLYAHHLLSRGQIEEMEQVLQIADQLLSPEPDGAGKPTRNSDNLSEADRRVLYSHNASLRCFLAGYRGDTEQTIHWAHLALADMSDTDLLWRSAILVALGDAYSRQGMLTAAQQARTDALAIGEASGDAWILTILNTRLIEILREQGRLQEVVESCQQKYKRALDSGIGETSVVGWLLGLWAEALAELNELDEAIARAEKGIALTARSDNGYYDIHYEVMSNLSLVRVLFSSGDIDSAARVVRSLQEAARQQELPFDAERQLSTWQVRVWLAADNIAAASRWAAQRQPGSNDELSYLQENEHISVARTLAATGELDASKRLLQRLLENAESGSRTSAALEILILQALACQAAEETDQAMTALTRALAVAEPCGFVRTFVDEGAPMARLLYEALTRDIAPAYVQSLLAEFSAAQSEPPHQEPDSSIPALIEPLSQRELEVLSLMSQGLTNADIADRLFITLNTVKVHTRNINGKLDAHNRTQAVAKARTVGILPPF